MRQLYGLLLLLHCSGAVYTGETKTTSFDGRRAAYSDLDRHIKTGPNMTAEDDFNSTTTIRPTQSPSLIPSGRPTQNPSQSPTSIPTENPTQSTFQRPSQSPSQSPTQNQTQSPSRSPTQSLSQSVLSPPVKERAELPIAPIISNRMSTASISILVSAAIFVCCGIFVLYDCRSKVEKDDESNGNDKPFDTSVIGAHGAEEQMNPTQDSGPPMIGNDDSFSTEQSTVMGDSSFETSSHGIPSSMPPTLLGDNNENLSLDDDDICWKV